jgi:DNA-3-methyladenine glycosylase
MSYKRLPAKFYKQKTDQLAQNLLGKYIVRQYNSHKLIGKIIETEMYYGHDDQASHAAKGKTQRTKLMFDQPGLAYIYLVYGMYYCFNIVTEKKEFPAAVLIRAVEPIAGLKQISKNRKMICHTEHSRSITNHINLTNGPGKFCQAFRIDKKLNGENLITSKKLYLAEIKSSSAEALKDRRQIKKAKRIGIDYADKSKNLLWRFYLKNNKFISKK